MLNKNKNHAEELILYTISKTYSHLSELELIPKDQLIKSFIDQAPFLVYPNEWIRKMTLEFCKIAYRSMTDPEIFCRIRIPFKSYLQNCISLMSHVDEFEKFIIPPISRFIIDLCDAKINHDLPYTNQDATAKLAINKILKEINRLDLSDNYFTRYNEYISTIEGIKSIDLIRIDVTTHPILYKIGRAHV